MEHRNPVTTTLNLNPKPSQYTKGASFSPNSILLAFISRELVDNGGFRGAVTVPGSSCGVHSGLELDASVHAAAPGSAIGQLNVAVPSCVLGRFLVDGSGAFLFPSSYGGVFMIVIRVRGTSSRRPAIQAGDVSAHLSVDEAGVTHEAPHGCRVAEDDG